MLFLFLTIRGNPSRPSMGLLALLTSFPWPSTQRYIQLNTHYFVLPRFLTHPSIMILSIGHYTDSYYSFCIVNAKPKPSQQHIKAMCLGPRALPTSSPTISYLLTLILPHTLPCYTQTCQIQFCPGTLHWWFHYQKCFGLDIHKTRFSIFLKCCLFNEAFQLHPT